MSATEARRVLGMTSSYSKASGSRDIRSVPFSKQNVDLPADAFRRPASPDEPAKKKAE